jgi:hypothetical protein
MHQQGENLMKACFTAIGISILSIAGVAGAAAQTPTTTPQTGSTAPSIRDSSKSGSPVSAGANTKPGASGDSTMNNGGAPNAGKMSKQSGKMSKSKKHKKEMDRMAK